MSLTYTTLNDALNKLVFSRLAHLNPEMHTKLKASFLNHTLAVADIVAATLNFDADNAGFKEANLSDSEFLEVIERNIGTIARVTPADDLPDGTYYTTTDERNHTDEFSVPPSGRLITPSLMRLLAALLSTVWILARLLTQALALFTWRVATRTCSIL